MAEFLWQFRIPDPSHLGDQGVTFFTSKASEMAGMLGYPLVETKNVKLEEWHNGVMMVSGMAVLGG